LKCVCRGLEKHFKEKEFEACAIKVYLNIKSVCIITVAYIELHQDFYLFITEVDMIQTKLYTSLLQYIICGEINIHYITEGEKTQLELLLLTYNL
jgi:hypothetical protein